MEDKVNIENLINFVKEIIDEANSMRTKHANMFNAHVGYCCIFCHSDEEYNAIDGIVRSFGKVAQDTPTGFTYVIPEIQTVAGGLRILKVRKPDPTRLEKGDADFSLSDYKSFKEVNLGREGFKLIERPNNEMIELMDGAYNVRAYFSYPHVEEHSGIREALSLDK